jgi:hypothetical protein
MVWFKEAFPSQVSEVLQVSHVHLVCFTISTELASIVVTIVQTIALMHLFVYEFIDLCLLFHDGHKVECSSKFSNDVVLRTLTHLEGSAFVGALRSHDRKDFIFYH